MNTAQLDTQFEVFAISLIETHSMVEPAFLHQDCVVQKIKDILTRHLTQLDPEEYDDALNAIYYLSDNIGQELLYPVLGVKEDYTTDAMRSGYEPYSTVFGKICNALDDFLPKFIGEGVDYV